ncbi:MAG: OmpA family protein [Spirochaetales bacterium]|nr:OmpA family protein [Spirochaetales bacterium]
MKGIKIIRMIIISLMVSACVSSGNTALRLVIQDCYVFEGHTYFRVKKELHWHEAKDRCEAVGGYLVVINTKEENDALKRYVVANTWIGFSDEETEGNFVWVNGDPVTFTDWANSQPSNGDGQELDQNYGHFWDGVFFRWNDLGTFRTAWFYCEIETAIEDPVKLAKILSYLKGEGEAVVAVESKKTQQVQDLTKQVQEKITRGVTVHQSLQGIKIKIGALQFKADTAELLTTDIAVLENIAGLLKQYDNQKIMIVGHTAKIGSEDSCRVLSEKRAEVIAGFLVNKNAVRKENIMTKGRGYLEPVADDATEAGRQKNRRVEIIILDVKN